MIGKMSVAVGLVTLLSLLGAGCSQAPPIPHPSEGLEAVDCLGCHELGLEGATKIPEGHLDDAGDVRYDHCDCHKPAAVEEEASWDRSTDMRDVIEVAGLVLGPIGLAVIGVFIVSGRKPPDLDV